MITSLIIEDDDTIQVYLKRLLINRFNSKVYQAANGGEGLKLLEEITPDLILLDLTMPVMNGREFLRKLRESNKFEDISILVLSASSSKEMVSEMIQLGVKDYILKSMDPDTTYQRIKLAINNKISAT